MAMYDEPPSIPSRPEQVEKPLPGFHYVLFSQLKLRMLVGVMMTNKHIDCVWGKRLELFPQLIQRVLTNPTMVLLDPDPMVRTAV
jgi:hypothetical protein